VLIGNFVTLATGGHAGADGGVVVTQPILLGIYAAVLFTLGLINTVTVRALGIVGEMAVGVVRACKPVGIVIMHWVVVMQCWMVCICTACADCLCPCAACWCGVSLQCGGMWLLAQRL
jgi:hypothetical protein